MEKRVRNGNRQISPILAILFIVSIAGIEAIGNLKFNALRKFEEARDTNTLEYAAEERTYLVSKFFLIPTLATIGLKFLLLLPIFLSKIALLSVMNFVASNLNLMLTAVLGVKKLFSSTNTTTPTPSSEGVGTKERVTEYQLLYKQPQYLPTYELLHDKISYQPSLALSNRDEVKFKRSQLLRKKYHYSKPEEPESRNIKDDDSFGRQQRTKYDQKGKYACFWLKEDEGFVKRKHSTDVKSLRRKNSKFNDHHRHSIGQNTYQSNFIDRRELNLPKTQLEDQHFSYVNNKSFVSKKNDITSQ